MANIKTALDYLHANVPRAFVNVVQILDIAMVKDLNAGFICSTLHKYVGFLCMLHTLTYILTTMHIITANVFFFYFDSCIVMLVFKKQKSY